MTVYRHLRWTIEFAGYASLALATILAGADIAARGLEARALRLLKANKSA